MQPFVLLEASWSTYLLIMRRQDPNKSHGKLFIAEILINYGVDIDTLHGQGQSLLHDYEFEIDVVEFLFKVGADVNIRNKGRCQPRIMKL
jgi:hypothetical protein